MVGTVSNEWVALAVITQPHGVSGRVKVKSFSDPADGFAHYALTDKNGNAIKLRITGQAQGQFIVEIDGLRDRNVADTWRGRELGVPRSVLKQTTSPDQFYVTDLEGMAVVNEAGESVGHVSAVVNYGAGDLLEITDHDGKNEFYTFTGANFPHVDREARRITFTPPDILGSREEEEGTV